MKTHLLVALALVLGTGCTSKYSVRVDGDVQGADRETPRQVKADIHDGAEARSARAAGRGHLRPLTDAKVTVALKFKGEDQPRASQTLGVDSRTAAFKFEASGEADSDLKGVVVKVEAPGRLPVERQFPHPGGELPFDAVLMAVLDEAGGPGAAPSDPGPAPTTDKAPPNGGGPAAQPK